MEEIQDSVLTKLLEEVIGKHTTTLEKKITIVEELAKRNDRTLRGNNGNLGLNAKVSRLEEELPQIKELIKELSTKLLTKAEMRLLVEEICSKKVEEEQEKAKEGARDIITFKWVFVEIVKPLLIAGFLYLLLEFFPAVGVHLGGG